MRIRNIRSIHLSQELIIKGGIRQGYNVQIGMGNIYNKVFYSLNHSVHKSDIHPVKIRS